MPDATLLVAGDGTIVYANSRVEDLLGWSPTELIGQHVECLVPTETAAVHGELRRRFTDDPHTRPMGSGLDLDARHRDGWRIPVEISLSPLDFDGDKLVIAAVRDTREQRQLRVTIVNERDRARALIDNLPDGVLEYDPVDGRYVTANPRFCELVGLSREAILDDEGVPSWIDPTEPDRMRSIIDQAIEVGFAREEIGIRGEDGQALRVMVTASVVRREGRSTVLALVHDLTDERRVAAEVEAARARLAVIEDRDRIARDLHDGVIQRLFAAGLHLQAAVGRPDQESRLLDVIDDIDNSIVEIRTMIFMLHGQRGLSSGLEHAAKVALAESSRLLGHQPRLEMAGELGVVREELGTEMLIVLRELLTNVVKHARATDTAVRIAIDATWLALSVEDDGTGFAYDPTHAGSGLKNLDERARRRGGTATISARSPQGTTIHWRVPLANGDSAGDV